MRLARTLVRGLQEEGHQVDLCDTAERADDQLRSLEYDAVILDWMLPDQDGLSLLRQWRGEQLRVPVLMLTARSAVSERIAGLRAGADDYLPKPFDFEELLARLEALHRRGGAVSTERELGDLRLDVRSRQLEGPAGAVSLTAREYALCELLLSRPGEVLTRTEILQAVWGPSHAVEPSVLDVYVGYLRKKLGEIGAQATRLKTVRGVGYRLVAEARP